MARTFNTSILSFEEKLKAAGADDGLAGVIADGIASTYTSEITTKADLADVENALRGDIQDVRDDLKDVESALRGDIAGLRGNMVWMIRIGITIVAMMVISFLAGTMLL